MKYVRTWGGGGSGQKRIGVYGGGDVKRKKYIRKKQKLDYYLYYEKLNQKLAIFYI